MALRHINQNVNIYKEIKNSFSNDKFLEEIKLYFNNFYTKRAFDKLKMPEKKDIESLDKEHRFLIEKNSIIEDIKIGKGEWHIYIFIGLLMIYCSVLLVYLNIELI